MTAHALVAYHRRARRFWIWAAPVALLLAAFGAAGHPWINTFIVGHSTWIWCIAAAAYHHGWLRAHEDLADESLS